VLAGMADAGFEVTHLYGLTETYGPGRRQRMEGGVEHLERGPKSAATRRPPGRALSGAGRSGGDGPRNDGKGARRRRDHGRGDVPRQYRHEGLSEEPAATAEAFPGGWFHSGDLGVMHEDGYLQLKDRSKDIIISGGENISSIEVEDALYKHPGGGCVAVVARPDDKWGETPCAFVELKPGRI
jgi:fatty-acyl-CoA synthase